jgi:hypothetical protein
MGAVAVALLAGLIGVTVFGSLNLGDSAVFGEGADGFVVGAVLGFAATYLAGLVLTSIAIGRSFAVHFLVAMAAVLAPSIAGLVLVGTMF